MLSIGIDNLSGLANTCLVGLTIMANPHALGPRHSVLRAVLDADMHFQPCNAILKACEFASLVKQRAVQRRQLLLHQSKLRTDAADFGPELPLHGCLACLDLGN